MRDLPLSSAVVVEHNGPRKTDGPLHHTGHSLASGVPGSRLTNDDLANVAFPGGLLIGVDELPINADDLCPLRKSVGHKVHTDRNSVSRFEADGCWAVASNLSNGCRQDVSVAAVYEAIRTAVLSTQGGTHHRDGGCPTSVCVQLWLRGVVPAGVGDFAGYDLPAFHYWRDRKPVAASTTLDEDCRWCVVVAASTDDSDARHLLLLCSGENVLRGELHRLGVGQPGDCRKGKDWKVAKLPCLKTGVSTKPRNL